ncbi:MAG: DNA adenine methylase [Polyangia bacterium]|jgi:DNA adenine methylase
MKAKPVRPSLADEALLDPIPDLDERKGHLRPFLKWAGGKTQLLPQFVQYYPPQGTVERYVEPFLGSSAVYFHFKALVRPRQAILSDNNAELIATYAAVKSSVDQLINLLRAHKKRHSKDFFLAMRQEAPTSPVAQAARLIYLNKTCFNGLYRVNSRGIFNVPFGRYTNPGIFDESALRAASAELASAKIEKRDFRSVLTRAEPGDFVYFDPPYHPLSSTAKFTSYTRAAFGESDQRDLAEVYRTLDRKGCLLMLSNSDTPLMHELYRGYSIRKVSARRLINSRADRRGPICEIVVVNDKLLHACRGKVEGGG